MKDLDDTLRISLHDKRNSLGLTERQMASLLDVSVSTYCNWERGRRSKCSDGNFWKIYFAVDGLFDGLFTSDSAQLPPKDLVHAMTRHRILLEKLSSRQTLVDEYADGLADIFSKLL